MDKPVKPEPKIKAPMRKYAVTPESTVVNLAKKGFPTTLIAEVMGITTDMLYRRFSKQIALGKQNRTHKVLKQNLKEALNGNDKALQREMEMIGVIGPNAQTGQVVINVGGGFENSSDDDLLSIIDGDLSDE